MSASLRTALAVAWQAVVSRQGRRRVVLLVLVGAVAALGVLATFGTAVMQGREGARAAAMVPVFGPQPGQGGAPVFGRPGVAETGWSELEQDYRGRTVKIVRVADPAGHGPLAPGVAAWPHPGQVLLSPALERLLHDSDGQIARWFADQDIAVLPPAAVGSAGQLLAYVGVAPEELRTGQGALVGFGGEGGPGFGWYPALGCMLFLVLPGFALVLTASRFGRQVRTVRYQALRLLGMPASQAWTGGAVETALPVAAGALLAVLAWPWLLPDAFALPVAGRELFGTDLRVTTAQSACTVLGLAVLAGVLGAATAAGSARSARGVRFLKPVRLTSPWVALLFGAGLLLVAVAYWRHKARDPLLWTAIVLLGAGLPSAAAWSGQRLARLLGRIEAGTVWLLTTRRLAADAQSRFRVAGMVGIAVFAVGAAQPVAQVLAQPNLPWAAQARAAGHTDLLARAETLESVPLRLEEPPAAVRSFVPAVALWEPEQDAATRPAATALVATCPQLEALFTRPLPDCPGGRMALHRADAPPTTNGQAAKPLLVRSADLTRAQSVLPAAAELTVPDGQDAPVEATMVLPPDDPALTALGEPFHYTAYLRVPVDTAAWEDARAWVVSASPAYRLDNSYQLSEVVDGTGSWVLLGLTTAAAITLLGAVLSIAEDGGRRREWFGLRALGVPRTRLTAVQLAESALTSTVTVTLATLASTTVGAAYLRINDDHLDTSLPYLLAALAGVATVLLTALASSWTTLRNPRRRSPAARPTNSIHPESVAS
ncbi:ABC transporter permease [Kitasatospora cineracea]|uniref:FtsX-like permease family protein n=1 Tax=Kitasatospora cineracea TaxID=88074 RepID=A0A8G1UN02_9ACTN|nr:ABC transporter permease [Kitasatospora cineracea]ROR46992.1 hypothetical protein EDD39_5301 [Kitasatospora cineracea]